MAWAQTSAPAPAPGLNTTQGHLDVAQQGLDQAVADLHPATNANRGGFVQKAKADLNQVVANMKDAQAYVAAHPEINPLSPGPAPVESPDLQPGTISNALDSYAPRGGYRALIGTINDLNTVLSALVNNPARDFHGPVLGDIGGMRAKIIAGIVQVGADLRFAINYADTQVANKAGAARGAAAAATPVATAVGMPLSPEQLKALVIVEGDYSRGSGFVAKLHDKFFIVTNLHVLSGNKQFTLTGIDGTKYPTTGALFGAMDRDVAILKIPSELAKNYLEIQDDPVAETKPGDAVMVPGNSEGAGVALQIPGRVLGVGPDLVEVDAKFVQGNSGSPIIHRSSGKVIGMATYTEIIKQDDLQTAANMREIRWFGVRLDNIDPKQWQALDWERFSDEGLKVRKVEDLSKLMIAFLQNQKLPPNDDDKVMDAIVTLGVNAGAAIKLKNAQEYLNAIQTFMQTLQQLAQDDLQQLAEMNMYAYHENILKQQQDTQAAIARAFAVAGKQIGAYQNAL
jgi:S1-C subfamily serine protease